MKKVLLLTPILSFLILSSCKNDKADDSDNLTIDNLKKINDLFSFGEIHKGNFISKNNYFDYSIVLDVINKSQNTFEKTIVETDLQLILHNNNILSVKDTDKVLNHGSIDKITFWKPNQTKVIGVKHNLSSGLLPDHFKEYPIKQVILVLKLTASDIVNKTEETIIHNIDITEDWKLFLSEKKQTSSKNKSNSKIAQKKNPNSAINELIKGIHGNEESSVDKSVDTSILQNSTGSESLIKEHSLNGRRSIYKPMPSYRCNESGKVVVEVTVNKAGETISAIAGVKGTTNNARCLLDQAKIAAMKTKWEASNDAPDEQIGTIIYHFSIN